MKEKSHNENLSFSKRQKCVQNSGFELNFNQFFLKINHKKTSHNGEV